MYIVYNTCIVIIMYIVYIVFNNYSNNYVCTMCIYTGAVTAVAPPSPVEEREGLASGDPG